MSLFQRLKIGHALAMMATCVCLVQAQAQTRRSKDAPVRDAKRQFVTSVQSWQARQNRNVVMQQRDYSCGAAALATLIRYYWGYDATEGMILGAVEATLSPLELQDREVNGLTMEDLRGVANTLGFQSSAGTLEYQQLKAGKGPVVLVVKFGNTDHYVVFRGAIAGVVFLADPIRGNVRISEQDFKRTWRHNAMLVVAPQGKTGSDRSKLGIRPSELTQGYLNRQLIRRTTSASNLPSHR